MSSGSVTIARGTKSPHGVMAALGRRAPLALLSFFLTAQGLAPGAQPGAGSGLAPGAGGIAPPAPPPMVAPPAVQLSPELLTTPGLAPVGGGPPLVPALPRRALRAKPPR